MCGIIAMRSSLVSMGRDGSVGDWIGSEPQITYP